MHRFIRILLLCLCLPILSCASSPFRNRLTDPGFRPHPIASRLTVPAYTPPAGLPTVRWLPVAQEAGVATYRVQDMGRGVQQANPNTLMIAGLAMFFGGLILMGGGLAVYTNSYGNPVYEMGSYFLAVSGAICSAIGLGLGIGGLVLKF